MGFWVFNITIRGFHHEALVSSLALSFSIDTTIIPMGVLTKLDIRTSGSPTHPVEFDPYTLRACPHALQVHPPAALNDDMRDHQMSLRVTTSRCSAAFSERLFDPI